MGDNDLIHDFGNLYKAHLCARKNKRYKKDVAAFELDLAANLWSIKERLESKSYLIKGYHCFKAYEPKEREIQALHYPDRIVQHSLCDNVLTPFFERRLIYDNCACQKGKGTHFGLARLEGFLRDHYKHHGTKGWILKADVRKYFASIDHEVLLGRLEKIIPDSDVMELLETLVRSYNSEKGCGLPMGNMTSQLFALYYLDVLDRLAKEKLRIKHYTRYMDDMVLVHEDKDHLCRCLAQMREMCENELKLELNEKTHIFPVSHGVDYLGWHLYLSDTGKVVKRLRSSAKKRFVRQVKVLRQSGKKDHTQTEDMVAKITSMCAHLEYGHTWKLRNKVLGCSKPVQEG